MPNDFSGIDYTPHEGETFGDYYSRAYGTGSNGSFLNGFDLLSKFSNIFTGKVDRARDIYDQWYNEQTAAKKAQADYEYTRMLNSTKYQDEIKAIRAAGLNPYALLANGGFSAGNMSYSSSEAPTRSSKKDSNGLSGKAVAAIAVVVAALIKAVA